MKMQMMMAKWRCGWDDDADENLRWRTLCIRLFLYQVVDNVDAFTYYESIY